MGMIKTAKKLRNYMILGTSLLKTMMGRKLNIASLLVPSHMTFLITKNCNSRCRMCNIWEKRSFEGDLTLKEIDRLSKNKNLKNILFLGVTGGEPFLRKDLVEAVRILNRNFSHLLQVGFSTNGFMPDKIYQDMSKIMEFLKCEVEVSVSLDGMHEMHNNIRRIPGGFEKAEKTIDLLKQLQKKHKNLDIMIRFTMLPENYKDLLPLYGFAKEKRISFMTKPATEGGLFDNEKTGFKSWKDRYTKQQLKEAINSTNKIAESEMQELRIKSLSFFKKIKRIASIMFLKDSIKFINNPTKQMFPCYASFFSFMVDNDGTILTCPILYNKLGNANKEPFENIWKGQKAKTMRRFIKDEKCACYTNCNQIPALVLKDWPKILYIMLKKKL